MTPQEARAKANELCDREIALVERVRCKRCVGRGVVGNMATGHHPCPECGGSGISDNDVLWPSVVARMRDIVAQALMDGGS